MECTGPAHQYGGAVLMQITTSTVHSTHALIPPLPTCHNGPVASHKQRRQDATKKDCKTTPVAQYKQSKDHAQRAGKFIGCPLPKLSNAQPPMS